MISVELHKTYSVRFDGPTRDAVLEALKEWRDNHEAEVEKAHAADDHDPTDPNGLINKFNAAGRLAHALERVDTYGTITST
jgi:hypothetical protein